MSTRIPGGNSTYSKQPRNFPSNFPKYLAWGRGVEVIGSDGKNYIDTIAGLGALILGYKERLVDSAVSRQMGDGVLFSLPTRIEGEVADQLCEATGAEMVKFGKNGSDATEAAVRLARFVTKRDRILTTGYHGFHTDLVSATNGKGGGVLESVKSSLLRVGLTDLDNLQHISQYAACLISEPRSPDLREPDWVKIREILDKNGCLLIHDNIITGFRDSFPGGYELADLECYGKAMANGFPLSAVVGPEKYMKLFESDVFYSGTYPEECLSLAAAGETIRILQEADYSRVTRYGEVIEGVFDAHAYLSGVKARSVGHPSRFQFRFDEPVERELFVAEMCNRGVLLGRDFFIMHAMEDRHVETICTAMAESLAVVANERAELSA